MFIFLIIRNGSEFKQVIRVLERNNIPFMNMLFIDQEYRSKGYGGSHFNIANGFIFIHIIPLVFLLLLPTVIIKLLISG